MSSQMPAGPPVHGAPPPPPPEPAGTLEPSPAPTTQEDRNRRLVATTAALALVSVALMIGVFLATRGDDPDPVSAPPPEPSPVTTPTPAVELSQVIDEVGRFVEEERGLRFREQVQVEALPEEEYIRRATELFDDGIQEHEESLREAAAFYQAVGFWPPEVDVVEAVTELFTTGTLGLYDAETDTLLVRGQDVTPLFRIALAHELTHALEDQHFELERPELDDRGDEAGFAFQALTEGSASRVETAYRETLTPDEQVAASEQEAEIAAGSDLASLPPILLVESQFPYVDGEAFVDAVVDAQGLDGLDDTFATPPTTTEQIMEPDSWLRGEEPDAVAEPDADGPAVDQGVAGQFVFDLLTGGPGGPEPVPEWDGDRYVLWQDDAEYCTRIAVEGDLDGFESRLQTWADQAEAQVARNRDQVVLTSCG
jgi:hypothetical protein